MSATSNVIEYAKQQSQPRYHYAVMLLTKYSDGSYFSMDDASHDNLQDALSEAYSHWLDESKKPTLAHWLSNPIVHSVIRIDICGGPSSDEMSRNQLETLFDKRRQDEEMAENPISASRFFFGRMAR